MPVTEREAGRPWSVCIADHPNVGYVTRGVTARLSALGYDVALLQPPYGKPPASSQVLMTCSAFPCDGALMASLPHLRGVAALASGTENIDVAAADSLGLVIAHAPTPQNVTSMAEATVLLILAGLYRFDRTCAELRQGWRSTHEPYARTLSGKTLGLVGFGRVAAAVAWRLRGWGVRILVHTQRPNPEGMPDYVRRVELAELLAASDVVSLHGRGPETGSGSLIGEKELALLKPGAVFVNTARGTLVDERALEAGVRSGCPSVAVLDCFQTEPLAADSPLRGLADAILTPHSIGHTREVQDSLVEQGVQNVLDIVQGRDPEFVRNPEALPAWHARWRPG